MAGGLRSQMQAHAQNSSSSDSNSHPMMSHMSQSGGKRSKGRKHRRRRSKRAGSTCMTKGGSYMAKSRAAKGGMGGLGAVIKEALVPFGLFAWQKSTQRRKHNGKKFGKSRRRR